MKTICLVLLWISADLFCTEPDFPRGQIIERVSCLRNASQTYALYLPAGYTPDRRWPILYALDPGARGVMPVQRFREAAEQYGYILAGSNNARNGPVKIVQDAVNALLEDTGARISIDPERIYLAGFSGGARGAILAALAAKGKIAGIVAFGAGSPADIGPARSIPFSLYLAAGIEDFNHPELRDLSRMLETLGVPGEFETFSGGHDWPPENVCAHALEWLELQAMSTGIRGKDAALIERIYSKLVEEAQSLEKEGQLYAALQRYSAVSRGFAGLKNTAGPEAKIKQLNQTRDVRKARSTEDRIESMQKQTEQKLAGMMESADARGNPLFAVQQILAAFEDLYKDAGQNRDAILRITALRVLSRFWILLNDEVALAFDRREYARAALRLETMARIRPDNPQVFFHLSRAYSLDGRIEKALEALRNAVAKGYTNFENLEGSRDLDPLRKNPEYKKLIDGLKKP